MNVNLKTRDGIKRMPYEIDVYGIRAFLYEVFLKKHGYSLKSSYRYERIKLYPQHFHKHTYGKWYISELYAQELIKEQKKRSKIKDLPPLPAPQQLKFNH